MRIGFVFYGILYGSGGRTGSLRDFRHCWPNIKSMLIDPFVEMGHDFKIFVSSYEFNDREIEKQFSDIIQPNVFVCSKMEGSDPFTAKGASFAGFENADVDLIVFTRLDVHWSKKIAEQNIDFTKFNFLFPEKDWWQTQYKFTCDNLYIWPHKMTSQVKTAMLETYGWPRGKPLVDTHGLMVKLEQYISKDDMHLISEHEELSDVNSFYTCCRNGLPKRNCMHEEVKLRYEKENWKYYE